MAAEPPRQETTGARVGGLGVEEVGARLDDLRRLARMESDEEARARLGRERPVATEPFADAVARRLRELRALCELADYLHRGRSAGAPPQEPP
jgi:hypothetical protein